MEYCIRTACSALLYFFLRRGVEGKRNKHLLLIPFCISLPDLHSMLRQPCLKERFECLLKLLMEVLVGNKDMLSSLLSL